MSAAGRRAAIATPDGEDKADFNDFLLA